MSAASLRMLMLGQTTLTNVRNPVLILRFVLLSFLFYLNLLALGFAAWNVSAVKSYDLPVDGAPVFVILNACALFIFLAITAAELYMPSRWAPQVLFECGWTGIMTILQLGAALDCTLHGPPILCGIGFINACASAYVLSALTWISSSIFFIYFTGLLTVASAHLEQYPAIWATSVTHVEWFTPLGEPPLPPLKLNPFLDDDAISHWTFRDEKRASRESSVYENPVFGEHVDEDIQVEEPPSFSDYTQEDIEKRIASMMSIAPSQTISVSRPAWARQIQPRRGIDAPFIAVKPGPRAHHLKSCWSATTVETSRESIISFVPPLPPKAVTGAVRVAARRTGSGHYDDLTKAMNLPAIIPTPSRPLSYGIFPVAVDDQDVPIRCRGGCKWVKADSYASSDGHSSFGP